MENKEYIVAIDLGDSNIVIAVGSAAEGGRINIDHILSRPSEGVSAGQIVNIDLAVKTIRTTLTELRETTGIEVHEAYAGISGEFIYCTSHTDHVFVPDHRNGVTKQVVEALFERMSNVMVSEDRFIMERIPQRYVINDTTEVDDPVGVFGSPLSSTFNFISSDNIPLNRMDMALRRLNIKPRRIFSNAVVVGDAVLSADEKEEGVVVVDLGGDLTDIAIYHRNVMRYISTIPMGAKSFNNDIRTLTIPERYIEPLKLRYGCALSKHAPQDFNVIIKGRSKHDQREIAIYNLAAVIEARARDIAELVRNEINDSNFAAKVPYGIVLTGGSAQLRYLDELFREVTGMEVRVAEAEDIISPQTRTRITSSADSTVVGLLIHGLKHGACAVTLGEPTVVAQPRTFSPLENQAPVNQNSAQQPPVAQAIPQQPVAQPEAQNRVVTPLVQTQPRVQPQPQVQPQQSRYTPPKQAQAVATSVITPKNETEQKPVAPSYKTYTEQKSQEQAQAAPVTINSRPREDLQEPLDEEVEELKEQTSPEQTENENNEEKPKRRILKLFSSFAKGANKWVNNVNKEFDVDEEI